MTPLLRSNRKHLALAWVVLAAACTVTAVLRSVGVQSERPRGAGPQPGSLCQLCCGDCCAHASRVRRSRLRAGFLPIGCGICWMRCPPGAGVVCGHSRSSSFGNPVFLEAGPSAVSPNGQRLMAHYILAPPHHRAPAENAPSDPLVPRRLLLGACASSPPKVAPTPAPPHAQSSGTAPGPAAVPAPDPEPEPVLSPKEAYQRVGCRSSPPWWMSS